MDKITNLSNYRKAQANTQAKAVYKTNRELQRQALIDTMGEPKESFYRVSHRTTASKRFIQMPARAKILFFALCSIRNRYQRQKAYFTRSIRQLMNDTGLSTNTVQKALQDLRDNGFLISNHRKSGRSRYQIVDVRKLKIVS